MNVEILIHGVPDGQDYYGLTEERTNAELFYDNSAESVKFVVETRKLENNAYAYYTYLRYKGMVGYGGRPGSYFGLTLRVDKYYQDVLHMYYMLDMVFKKYVIGALLSQSGESYKYLVPSFASKRAEIEQLQQGLIQLIQGTCVWSKFVDLDASFIHPITTVASCNIVDVTDNVVLATIKKYSKVVLSPDYKTNLSKEYEKKIQEAEGKGGALVAEKDKKLVEKDGVINSLNLTISSHQAKIEALQSEVKRKDLEISQIKDKSNLSKMISGIKEPIYSLAEYFRVHDARKEPPAPSYGRKNFLIGVAGCAFSLIILALCVVLLVKNPKGTDPKLSERIAELNQKNDQLTREIESKNIFIADLQAQLKTKTEEPQPAPTPSPIMKTLSIDVAGYSKGPLMTDKEYTITIKEGKNKFNGKGKWLLTNAEIKKGNESDTQITITPTGKGNVVLNYQSDNCTCKGREFLIKAPSTETQNSNTGGNNGGSVVKPDEQESIINFDIIVDPDVSEVEINKSYTFSISGYEGKGTWRLDGFDTSENKESRQIKVTAKAGGSGNKATVSYTPEGGEKKTKSFNYKANE